MKHNEPSSAGPLDRLVGRIDPISGFMRGNHSFLTWETPAKAAQAVSDGIYCADARLFELAFVGHGPGSHHLHREMDESTVNFMARSETFFRKYCEPPNAEVMRAGEAGSASTPC